MSEYKKQIGCFAVIILIVVILTTALLFYGKSKGYV